MFYFTEDEEKVIKEQSTTSPTTLPLEVPCPLPVRTLSCGKEHVLLLSTLGTVVSYGSGRYVKDSHRPFEPTFMTPLITMFNTFPPYHSRRPNVLNLICWNCSRGQLGHGSTGACSEPTIIDALNGLTMVSIAAGGWHSAAISGMFSLQNISKCTQNTRPHVPFTRRIAIRS